MGVEVSEAVAIDRTVRVLEECEDDASDAKYSDAVEKIWRDMVKALRRWNIGVVSESLNSWNREIELYLWDPGFCDNLVEKNKSIDALDLVRVYVKDAEAKMGPPFLEVAADLLIRNNRLDLVELMSVSNAGHNMDCDQVRGYESTTTGHNAGHDMECDQVRDN